MRLHAKSYLYPAILFMLVIIVAAAGCSGSDSQQASSLPSDKYVAVLEFIDERASVINGTCTLPVASPRPPYPFDYDSSKGRLTLSTPANESLKILYGSRHEWHQPWFQRYDLDTCGIYGLPYSCESGPVITGVGGNGTVSLRWDNQSIALKPGDKWSRESEPEVQVINVSGYSPFTARLVTAYSITNLGMFDKPGSQ